MTLAPARRKELLSRITSPSGALCMVAMDQRESLRTMFQEATNDHIPDSLLSDFKRAVAEVLSPHASAMLLDPEFGSDAIAALDPGCGLVIAVDKLIQVPGQPVEDTDVDPLMHPTALSARQGAALKLLLLWRPDRDPAHRSDVVTRFLELCESAGVLSILEGVVRPPVAGADHWDRDAAVLAAARELGAHHPDIYKAEVPMRGRGDLADIQRCCEAITAVLPCPWVVLSQGVTIEDYPRGVEAACKGGASGFLAGRALWSDVVGPGDYRARLATQSVPRLERLSTIVEQYARPAWTQ